jgi:hypothetical protein
MNKMAHRHCETNKTAQEPLNSVLMKQNWVTNGEMNKTELSHQICYY